MQSDLIARLNQAGDSTGKKLSKGHRLIGAYMVEHYDKAAFMTAAKLGQTVGVSESTVVRFAVALGYEGYPQLQKALQEIIRHRLTAMQRIEMSSSLEQAKVLRTVLKMDMHNIRTTLENMDEMVFARCAQTLCTASRVYVLGMRSSAPLAQFLGHYLHFVFDNITVVTSGVGDVLEQMARIGKDDVLVGISFPRYSSRTVEAMQLAKAQGAHIIAITDGQLSPLYALSDNCLCARSEMASFVDSLAAPLSLINALIVAVGLAKKKELSEHLAQLEGIWGQYGLYTEKERT